MNAEQIVVWAAIWPAFSAFFGWSMWHQDHVNGFWFPAIFCFLLIPVCFFFGFGVWSAVKAL